MVARVPKPVGRSVRHKLRYLTELLGWSTLDPIGDTTLVLTAVADICHRVTMGTREEIVLEIRQRAELLRQSPDRDDLVAAGELDDLAEDLEAPILLQRDDPEDDAHSP
jgi:hypothetical protein